MDHKQSVLTQELINYEQGLLNEDETIDFFQRLLETGLVWNLQGHYGRTAKFYLETGQIHAKTKETKDKERDSQGTINIQDVLDEGEAIEEGVFKKEVKENKEDMTEPYQVLDLYL